jgi:hypothetical protein
LLCDMFAFNKIFCASLLMVFLLAIPSFGAADTDADTVIAEGDGFKLTQRQIDDYRLAIAPNSGQIDKKALLAAVFRFELLSREYAENQKKIGVVTNWDGSGDIEMKIHAARIYIQQILNDYVVPEDVIVSYYRSYPEKYKIEGNTATGKMAVLPLDDNLKNEIKFMIVEKIKNVLIEETVENLMLKYHIRIINEYQ